MTTKRQLIKNATIVTMDDALGDIENGDILVAGSRIEAVGPNLRSVDAELIDATGKIVIPGFVDTHRHVWQTQLRGVATDWTIVDYMVRMRTLYCVCYEPEDAYLGNYVGGLEAVNAGITSIVDHSHLQISPEYSNALARGLIDSGIGGFFCYGFYNNPPYRPGDTIDLEAVRKVIFAPVHGWHQANAKRVRDTYFSDANQPLKFGIATSEVFLTPFENVRQEIEAVHALKPGLISMHWGVGLKGKNFPTWVAELDQAGLLTKEMLFVHVNDISDEDFATIGRNGAGVSATPDTELGMGMGFPVQERALSQGASASFGVDIVSNIAGDMFGQIRLGMQSQRWNTFESLNRLPTEMAEKARDYLRFATLGGAESIGRGDAVGSITPGKQADLVIFNTDSLWMCPVNDPVGAIVFYANVSDIDSVMIAGEFKKRNGELLGVNWHQIRGVLVKSRDRIMANLSKIPFDQVSRLWHDMIA